MSARFSHPGFLLALLALLAQLALGGFVPRSADLLALQDIPICHHEDGSGGTPVPAHHPGNCALCPLCSALSGAHVAALPASAPLPGPLVLGPAQASLPPPAAAPPVFAGIAAQPRGPPVRLI
jgi:hypothetical protein